MAIKVLVILFSALLFGNGIYFLKHTKTPFLMFNPQNNVTLSKILKYSGIILIIVAIIGFAAALTNSLILIIITLILGCICCVIPELLIMQFINK
ncbi:hypothetical protein ACQW5G_06615 [Fructilactobacillus sp. Tb1]|uniref:hypothetical protein n=1 Tax=Fructilactobacillus sp. Tb1 TaxID=3422304 RepID=UPI003D2C82F1